MSRIFVAIPLSSQLQEEAKLWQVKYKDLPVRFVKPKNLHITILPPWDTADIEEAKDRLLKIKASDVELIFDEISLGPNPRRPNLIWASGPTPKKLLDLQAAAQKVFDKNIDRRLKLHATLARVKSFASFATESILWHQKAARLVLMESRLLPGGADYQILASIDLTQALS